MKKTAIAIYILFAGTASAQDERASRAVAIDDVEERISVIEVIDVTAEKPPALVPEETDADIDAILDEAEALEDDEEAE